MTHRCKLHPTYSAKRHPRPTSRHPQGCKNCWEEWQYVQGEWVDALFVDINGPYPLILGAQHCWEGEVRDARDYGEGRDRNDQTGPVVAHPPCGLWTNFAASNYARATRPCQGCGGDGYVLKGMSHYPCGGTGRREPNRKIVKPAWYPGGSDMGGFESALKNVMRFGGVLEHPANTHAWKHFHLGKPFPLDVGIGGVNVYKQIHKGWTQVMSTRYATTYWVCSVYQSAYDHKCQKDTWLLYCGKQPPFELNWERKPGTHQVGWFDRKRPTVSKVEASRTPIKFALELVKLAVWSRG